MQNNNEYTRWLEEAKEEVNTAKWDLQGKKYSAVCFWCQQAGEKALKAYLYFKGERIVYEHSVSTLAEKCSQYSEKFKNLIEKGIALDRYYIPTRYPNGLPFPAVPFESFTEEEAKDAISLVEDIIKTTQYEISKDLEKWEQCS